MARINIEDSLYSDHRFIKLVTLLGGDLERALGALVRAFSVAQRFFLDESNGRQLPLNEWRKHGLNDAIIESGLAEVREHGIYMRGSAEQFSWLIQKQNAGKQSALLKKEKKKENSTSVNVRERTPTSSSSSSSSSISSSFSVSKNALANASKNGWDSYRTAYLKRYQSEPIRNAKVNSLIKQLASRLPGEHLGMVIEFYLGHTGSYYVQRGHSLECLVRDAEKVYTEWKTGRKITRTESNQADQDQALADRLKKIERGDL